MVILQNELTNKVGCGIEERRIRQRCGSGELNKDLYITLYTTLYSFMLHGYLAYMDSL